MEIAHRQELEALPAYRISGKLNKLLEECGRVIVTSPPGTGKSTVLPLTILEGIGCPVKPGMTERTSGGQILILEPRRIAAIQIAERMAWLLGEPVGKTVGYRIRFEGKVSKDTRITVLTEGILSRMLIDDPGLEGVSVIIFDEFHERGINCDEALAMTLQSQSLLREDLRVVLMSATIDVDSLSKSLEAPVLQGGGKMFPVEIKYMDKDIPPEECVPLIAHSIREAHSIYNGDILAFLPGEAEIRRCSQLLGDALGSTHIYPLYGMLSSKEQGDAIAPSPPGERKVVLATPIAETSLTIEGVRVVIDSGLYRRLVFDHRSGLDRLQTMRISMDMAEQRSGRAGRVAPGVCYRLWSLAAEKRMAKVRTPEILDADLSALVLDMAAWGEKDILSVPWITPPPAAHVSSAVELLKSLHALDDGGNLTAHGRVIASFPCHPRLANMLSQAKSPEMRSLASDIAALLGERDPLPGIQESGLDIRVNALRKERMRSLGGKWARIARAAKQYAGMVHAEEDNSHVDPYEVGGLVASAYPERIGKAWKDGAGRYQLPGGEIVAADSSDPLCASEWIAVADMNLHPGGVGRIFLAAPVSPDDLREFASSRENISWDAKAGKVSAVRESRIGVLTLSSSPLQGDFSARAIEVICEATKKYGLSMFNFSDKVQNLQRRITTAAAWHPELGIPDVSTSAILAAADEWVHVFIGNALSSGQMKKVDICEVIWSRMDYQLRKEVERISPSHITVPTGSNIALEYRQGADVPVLRVRIQECFGMTDTPKVDSGKRAVLMELLSPRFKPVQLTSDLRSFWSGTYFEVRGELRRRYPKHYWPDNPLEATPVRGVKRKN